MRIAVFTKNRTNPAYAGARLGAERVAASHGAVVTHYVPETPDSAVEQTALVAEALAAKPDAFVFVPADVEAMKAPLANAIAAGVPVVTLVNRIDVAGVTAFVGAEDHALARAIALYLGKHLQGRGNVAILEGTPGAITNTDRVRGFRDALASFPEIEVLATLRGEYQREDARRALDAFLASDTPLDAVIAANDSMALGALDALQARGRHAIVTGVNAIPDAVAAIRRGTMLATVDFDAMKIASIATEAAIRHLRGEAVPREIMLPTQVVDRANCAAWDKPLEARGAPPWEEVVRSG